MTVSKIGVGIIGTSADRWFDNHQGLVSSRKIDLIVTVKVPHHLNCVNVTGFPEPS